MVRINPLQLQSSTGNLIWDGILIQSGSTPSSAMAGRIPSPTFNTHLANSRCFSKTKQLIIYKNQEQKTFKNGTKVE
jgi:hypothetical protein